MASSWQHPENEVSNYDFYDNNDVRQTTVIGGCRWCSPEVAAWRCNQRDDCGGFTFNKAQGYGAWFVKRDWNWSGTDYSRQTYVKKSTSWLKAKDPDTSDPSILPVGQGRTKVRLFSGGGCTGTEWDFTQPGPISPSGRDTWAGPAKGSGYPDHGPTSYIVPLGWKFVFDSCGNDGGCDVEGYYDRGAAGGQCYTMDSPNYHGMVGHMTDGIIQNIGFDVDHEWDNMAGKGVDSSDELLIKQRWCKSRSASELVANATRCQGTTSAGATILNQVEYNTTLVNACLADTAMTWASQPAVLNALKSIILNGQDTGGQVLSLFHTYCRGDPTNPKSTTGHRSDYRCACINAADFGFTGTSNCFDSPMNTFPGCATYQIGTTPHVGLVDRIKPVLSLPPNLTGQAINSLGNAPGCVTEACALAQTVDQNQQTFPYQSSTCPALNIQICGININVGAAQDSPIDAQCTQSQVINPPAGSPGAPPASPGAPPGSPGAPPGSPLPVPALGNIGLDTPTKQYGGIGGCVFFICICCIIILLLVSGGDSGEGSANLLAARMTLAGG